MCGPPVTYHFHCASFFYCTLVSVTALINSQSNTNQSDLQINVPGFLEDAEILNEKILENFKTANKKKTTYEKCT